MAEGIALAIPGLFLNCVEYFTLVQLGCDFKEDFGSWHLQLRANELRFQRWGNAAGITDELSETFVKRFQENYEMKDIKLAYRACDQIKTQLSRAKEDSDKMSMMSDDPAELTVIDEFQQLAISAPDVKHANGALNKLKGKYQSGLRMTTKVVVRSKWALYKKTQLEDLLRVIAEHVTMLETLFPQQEKVLAAQEARELEPAAMKALKDVVTTSDPLLKEALRAAAPQNGFSWDNVVSTGYATVHLGHNFRNSSANVGHQEWNRLRSDGCSTVHAGNNYDYEAAPQTQSAWTRNPPPTVPNAMDHPDFPFGPDSSRAVVPGNGAL